MEHVTDCGYCHTPLCSSGAGDETLHLAGRPCAMGPGPVPDDRLGCLQSRNLAHPETGLAELTDDEVLALLLDGERPEIEFLHGLMPFWIFGSMADDDARAVVAYLRTLPGIDREIPTSDPNYYEVKGPAPRIDLETEISKPAAAESGDLAAAERGRYLANAVGACIFCHSAPAPPGQPRTNDVATAFQGNRIIGDWSTATSHPSRRLARRSRRGPRWRGLLARPPHVPCPHFIRGGPGTRTA